MNARITAAVVAAFAANHVAAQGDGKPQNFQIELFGGLTMFEADTSPDLEITQFFVGGIYHLKPVALANHPWNEAAFLEHSMAISALLDYTDFEISSFSADGVQFGAGFRFADKETPIAADLGFQVGSLDGNGADIDLTRVNGRCGYWLAPNAIAGIELGIEEIDAGGALDVDTLRFGAFGKIVHDLGEGRSVNGEAHLGFAAVDDAASDETNIELGFAGDFYFTPQHSVGAVVDFSFGDAVREDGITLGLRGSAWVTPKIAVGGAISTFMAGDDNGADETTLSLFVNMRL